MKLLVGLITLVMVFFSYTPTFAVSDEGGNCYDLTISNTTECEIEVLQNPGDCPGKRSIANSICEKLKEATEPITLSQGCGERCVCKKDKDIDEQTELTKIYDLEIFRRKDAHFWQWEWKPEETPPEGATVCNARLKATLTANFKGSDGTCKCCQAYYVR